MPRVPRRLPITNISFKQVDAARRGLICVQAPSQVADAGMSTISLMLDCHIYPREIKMAGNLAT